MIIGLTELFSRQRMITFPLIQRYLAILVYGCIAVLCCKLHDPASLLSFKRGDLRGTCLNASASYVVKEVMIPEFWIPPEVFFPFISAQYILRPASGIGYPYCLCA